MKNNNHLYQKGNQKLLNFGFSNLIKHKCSHDNIKEFYDENNEIDYLYCNDCGEILNS